MGNFTFPDLVNERKVRITAGIVVIVSFLIIITDQFWLAWFLALNYLLTVSAGPRFSPFARLADTFVLNRFHLKKKMIPGPPKRFAQLIGTLLSLTILFCFYYLENLILAKSVVFLLLFFSTLESFVGFCAGCYIFGLMMRIGLIPAPVCEKCLNISKRSRE